MSKEYVKNALSSIIRLRNTKLIYLLKFCRYKIYSWEQLFRIEYSRLHYLSTLLIVDTRLFVFVYCARSLFLRYYRLFYDC